MPASPPATSSRRRVRRRCPPAWLPYGRLRLGRCPPRRFLPDVATSLNNLSLRLGDLGRREDALAAIQELVGVWQRLSEM
jgi:hypothetical protein